MDLDKPKRPLNAAQLAALQKGRAEAWKPGQSGNPAGRPKGSRNSLSELFLADMLAVHQKGGKAAIERVMKEQPAKYLAALCTILPRQYDTEVDIRVTATSAVDSLLDRLDVLVRRDVEYKDDRANAIKTIEHDPARPIAARAFEREREGGSSAKDAVIDVEPNS